MKVLQLLNYAPAFLVKIEQQLNEFYLNLLLVKISYKLKSVLNKTKRFRRNINNTS